ncbi:hypothetical protein C8R47DRAFT_1217677 [Mycena vitilis]|nr:hypothetical protein C8R47DRAFT_1217677 [Mycena vitilis]
MAKSRWICMSEARSRALHMAQQPLPDPCNSYKEDAVLALHKHPAPSTPADANGYPILDDDSLLLERCVNGRLANCGRHTIIPATSSPLHIKLLEPLSVGLRVLRLAQVWKVELGDRICVARIYDPLYVELDLGAEDVFPSIERLVASENTAYDRLHELQGNLIAKFIDCFLTMVDTTDDDILRPIDPAVEIPNQRSIWVLLSEYVPGIDLEHKQPSPESPVCDKHKLAVIWAACVAWHSMAQRFILHDDFADRNLVLKTGIPSTDPFCEDSACNLRFLVALGEHLPVSSPIAVIDFENSEVTEEITSCDPITDLECAKARFPKLNCAWFHIPSDLNFTCTPGRY